MTYVPQMWLDIAKKEAEHVQQVCAASLNIMSPSQIMEVCQHSGHTEVQCTIYFVRRICPSVTKSMAKSAIRTCVECTTIDLTPVHWEKGKLGVNSTWHKLIMDITHYCGSHNLTLTYYSVAHHIFLFGSHNTAKTH